MEENAFVGCHHVFLEKLRTSNSSYVVIQSDKALHEIAFGSILAL